tara:strand:+ start:442 stop:1044 length:603 start_codon:yes stop_codon:yes gene_type:complete
MLLFRTLAISLFIIIFSLKVSAQVEGIANDRDGVVFFIEAMPASAYRHLGTVECSSFSPDDVDPLLDHVLKQARKNYEEFDALIFRPGKGMCKADAIQFYRDPKVKRRRGSSRGELQVDEAFKRSKAGERNGMMIFLQNNPSKEYTLLGRVETPVTFRSKDIEELIKEIGKISKNTYPDMDAIVIIEGSRLRKASVIKFK